VALSLLALVFGAFAALLFAAGDRPALLTIGPYLGRVLGFSLAQAAVSTVLSLALGTALALALARRRFPGRELAMAALGAAAVMPSIVVVFAVLAVYGRSGWLMEIVGAWWGAADVSAFGWPGILIAHVFLNAPLVARVLYAALASTPAEQWRLAAMLDFRPADVFRHLDWPPIRAELPGIAGLVFLLCFTSFAVVLSLGGGPGRATLEVAIYEALKLDLDFARAAWLAFVQVAICLGLTLVLHWAVTHVPIGQTTRAAVPRTDTRNFALFLFDLAVLLGAALLIAPPLVSVLSSLPEIPGALDQDVREALLTSLAIATAAGAGACALALALGAAARQARSAGRVRLAVLHETLPGALLAVPPFALTAGLYLGLRRVVDPSSAGYVLLPLINALGALPFAYRFIGPALTTAGERYGRLSSSLGLTGWAKLRIVDWPLLRVPLAGAFAIAAALSFGDFGVVALFGGTELRTLPYLLYERLGAYRIDESGVIGALIVLVTLSLAYLSSRLAHVAS
jgi:thiamine transport system permease protein